MITKTFYCLICGSSFESIYRFGEPCPYCKSDAIKREEEKIC
jgi:DNA-directed RNA polymerase subunit RPC12/RpoP